MSHGTVIAECIIRKEIKDWFKKLINETYGSAVEIRYLPIDNHFNTHMYAQISTNQSKINQVIDFVKNISDMLNYKAPWLNETSYYVLNDVEKEEIVNRLKTIAVNKLEVRYTCLNYRFIGIVLKIFNFHADLDDNQMKKIDEIFNIFYYRAQQLITYPKMISPLINANSPAVSTTITTRMLTAFHGKFLLYLTLQDIMSLEIANKQNDWCYDVDLDHDIQCWLRFRFPALYDGVRRPNWSLRDFKSKELIYHFIHKYHDRLIKTEIPNILTVGELQSLSRLYNIELVYNNLLHIDFKSLNDVETINFCAICHFQPNPTGFFSYDTKYAVNYSVSFNAEDDLLDPLTCKNEFTLFVGKSQNNCSSKQSDSILKLIAGHFMVSQSNSLLILYEFDLNHVSSQTISSLLRMIRIGSIIFYASNLTYKTLILILQRCDQNKLEFKECHFTVEHIAEPFSINSKIEYLCFSDMDIELSLLPILNAQIKFFDIKHCRILRPSYEVPINNKEIIDVMWFCYCTIDISTLLRFLNELQCIRRLGFVCCVVKPSASVAGGHFTLQNQILFRNQIFHIQTLFQMIEKCEIQNRIFFENCSFPVDGNDKCYNFLLKPVKIVFHKIKFDFSALSIILGAMNNKSDVWIMDSCIFPFGQDVDANSISTKLIHIKGIQFANCRLETQTLLKILGNMSEKCKVNIVCCELLHSTAEPLNILIRLPKLVFQNMKLNTQHLFAILKVLQSNSSVEFMRCTLISGEFPKTIEQMEIEIIFSNMIIEANISELLQQSHLTCIFNKCRLGFMTDEFLNISIQAHVTFKNMFIDFSTHLKCLVKLFTPKSRIEFQNCQFEPTISSILNAVIRPLSILFIRTVVELDVLINILERISDQTHVVIDQCNIHTSPICSTLPIKILHINFKNMSLELATILTILRNFTSQSSSSFDNCKILCSHPNELSDSKLIQSNLTFNNMIIDAHVFQMIVQKCRALRIDLENTNIIPARIPLQPNVSNNITSLLFRNVIYSPEILQLLQYINRDCFIIYCGELSDQSIIEICIKTAVHGERFRIISESCTESYYLELFAEFFRPIALNFEHETDTEVEYNLPAYLIPDFRYQIRSPRRRQYDWNAIKIKFILVNDVSVKLEFLKNCKPIDLFQELNDLPADSRDKLIFCESSIT